MNDIEKLNTRITSVNDAIAATKVAATLDRKLSHDKHMSGHFTKALTELTSVKENLDNQLVRIQTIGR